MLRRGSVGLIAPFRFGGLADHENICRSQNPKQIGNTKSQAPNLKQGPNHKDQGPNKKATSGLPLHNPRKIRFAV
jgi:hypothetical protein